MTYHELVDKRLAIAPAFFSKYQDTIRERLSAAADELLKSQTRDFSTPVAGHFGRPDLAGINQALHLASNVLLLGASPENVRATMDALSRDDRFSHHDPSTVVTVAVLYFLLNQLQMSLPSQPEAARRELRDRLVALHRRFDNLQWMTDATAMGALAIEAGVGNTLP